ncbi:hypothetical protein ACNF42_00130 [Cuniculiplasma sp. SKW3]|uniref:hypothetical protein n=1 Tax=unclassified Cuniculiplasma TaxID=2619706 RepID=UPI003FD38B77
MVFLRQSFNEPVEFITEAYKRSRNYKKTRFKEQASYFMCLIAGETKLEKAISAAGFLPDDRSSIIITDSDDVIRDILNKGLSLSEYITDRNDEKKLYGEMTLVELELIKSD